jgi:TolB-like protein
MKYVQSFLCLLIVMCIGVSSYSQTPTPKKITIAVIDLESRGATAASEAVTLTDRLRSLLVRTNVFNVVDRGKMQSILQEVGFQQSGCTSTECAVEVGKLLNVEQMIAGSIGRIGSLYTVDIVLIEVETSRILKSFTRDHKGEIEGLIDAMSEIAEQLVEPTSDGSSTTKVGTLNATSDPVSAEVFLDNKKLGITPLKMDKINEGEHTVTFLAKGYKSKEGKIQIKSGKINNVNATLVKKGGSLKWVMLGGGTAAAAGGAAFFLLGKKDKTTETATFPAPPGRPN